MHVSIDPLNGTVSTVSGLGFDFDAVVNVVNKGVDTYGKIEAIKASTKTPSAPAGGPAPMPAAARSGTPKWVTYGVVALALTGAVILVRSIGRGRRR